MQQKDQLLFNFLKEGSVSISNFLLTNYSKIGLFDQEMMLIVHILYFQSRGNFFPSINELEDRMSLNTEEIMRLLQRLVKGGYIYIEETREKDTGKISEIYNLDPLFFKLINVGERNFEINEIFKNETKTKNKKKNLFKIFEEEFGRPLSPMEIELINSWLDNEKYHEDIIIYALKEAVFSNKLNFRYIDKILFEWQKKNLKTVAQVKEHIKNFRVNNTQNITDGETKLINDIKDFEFYNWLEND